MEQWFLHTKKADFMKLGEALSVHPVITRVLVNRGVVEEKEMAEFLHPDLEQLHDPFLMKDMEKAVLLLQEAIDEKKKILIIGDYDIDGIQSTYILHQGLQRLGANVDYRIPHRIEDGYGINLSMIQEAVEQQIDLIITCDNGISAMEAIQAGKQAGMTIIITDHHDVPYVEEEGRKKEMIPPADAVINPKQEDCNYPFAGLCGGAVAWKVMVALYQKLGYEKEVMEQFLEHVGFATIGDIMELQGENRVLVTYGLRQIQQTKNIGMEALIQRCGLEKSGINAYQIGFVLGPCMNAGGRLETADMCVKLLEETDIKKATAIAAELVALNEERKLMTQQGVEQALLEAEKQMKENAKVLVIYLPQLHESLAGIVAGRIKEQFYRPTLVLTNTTEGAKGSGRSIEGYNMYQCLVAVKHRLTKFGGHPMAAGLSLPIANIDIVRKELNEKANLTEEDLHKKVWIDMAIPFQHLTEDLIRQLDLLEPFGNGNGKPVFAQKKVSIQKGRFIGKQNNYLSLQLRDQGNVINGLYFGPKDEFEQQLQQAEPEFSLEAALEGKWQQLTFSIVYYPQINEFRGRKNLQIILQGIRVDS